MNTTARVSVDDEQADHGVSPEESTVAAVDVADESAFALPRFA
jgi:hypothetical protein